MQTDFEKAEKEGLTKLVYIPFHSQHIPFVELIREQPEHMLAILNDYIHRLKTKIGFIDEDFHLLNLPIKHQDIDLEWEEFEKRIKDFGSLLEMNRLVHLTPLEIMIDEEDRVVLCCEYDSKGLDKYIPPHFKLIYAKNEPLIDNIRLGNTPVGAMWNFAPIYFVTPLFGKYIDV